ncbi:hypothetical protein U4960_09415 [Altererythrobacter sp. H2]|uniref:hypothetical protein n=1 Tax=Altererythrobacter sp. H2 TaxID=3108391 RepID=UPI002B4BEF45|nr:hypothetical protein [Altererythrobacter sp. H2]WRK94517.1 hypothetical protein U4960_09415 [Altererythrobacter sp. H2]
MAETSKTTPKKTTARKAAPTKTGATAAAPDSNTAEAKTRFNAALEEAKAGAAALKAEASGKAVNLREQAKGKGEDWVSEAKAYGEQAKGKAGELAVEGKTKASDALSSLGKMVADNAPAIDERFGTQYGDYARKASRTLHETSAKLDNKSVEEIGDDARKFVRESPGLAVGLAAVAGFLIARVLRGNRD